MIFTFGAFELDDEHYQLREHGRPVELRRKVFDVLRYLVAHSDRLVSKEELLEHVWPGETIHEGVVPQNVAILRRVLGDSREAAKIIQTVHGRGYRFVASVASVARTTALAASEPSASQTTPERPFVGREHVMQELHRSLRDAIAGSGRLIVVTGEPGIGKTRLSEELAAQARELGARVLEGRCHEGDGAPAYWAWTQILRAATDEGERQLGELPQADPRDSAEARFRLFDGISSFLARIARAQPLLLVFDDLHWADEATLHLLQFFSREVRKLPVLVLATSRDVDARAEPVTAALISGLQGGTQVQRIYLSGLSQDATRELLGATLQRELDEPTLRELHALTEGNPFFVHEVARLLADEAAAGASRDERWRLELPRRVREVISLRLSGLGPEVQRVLQLAAVIGRDFSVAVLEQVAGLPRAQLLALLESAAAARIVHEAADPAAALHGAPTGFGRYRFAHALIRESLYAALPESERVRAHEQVGLALEALFGVDADAHLDELAHHFYRAASGGDVERAVSYCERAAQRALDLLAFEQAVLHYRRALEALACRLPIDEQRRYALKLALGSAQFRAGEDGNPALLGAAEIARRLGRPELIGHVVLAMCGWPRFARRWRTANDQLFPLLTEALEAPLQDAPALRARLLAALAINWPWETPIEQRLASSREALELARAAGHDEALYDALLSRLQLTGAPEDTALRLELGGELVTLAERLGPKERIFTAHEQRVQPLLALGELAAADREIEICDELARELRLRRCSLQVLRFRLERALGDGRFDAIRPLTREAVHVRGRAAISAGYMANLFIWRTFERALRGDRPWFERHIEEMALGAEKSNLMRSHVAYLYAQFGRLEQARACYAPLLDAAVLHATRDDDMLLMSALTSHAVALCRDADAARALYPRLLPHAALNVVHLEWFVYFGCCAHFLGLLAALLGDHEAASAHFEMALAKNTALGARPALCHTSLAYARMLLERDAAGDGARAQRLLRDALALAEDTGMQAVLRDAQQLVTS